ncbi:MAG: hypothetical protein ABIH82_00315 [Candidatus Woesearchaeota archaeon]
MKKKSDKVVNSKNTLNWIVIIVAVVLISSTFFVIDLFKEEPQTEVVTETVTGTINDFPSDQAGTLNGYLQVDPNMPVENTIVLFSSAKISGLAMVYYPKQKRVVVGMPPMVADNVDLFDGKEHNVIYTFEKEGMQAFFIDKQIVVSGNYKPYSGAGITGMVIGISENIVSGLFDEVVVG